MIQIFLLEGVDDDVELVVPLVFIDPSKCKKNWF